MVPVAAVLLLSLSGPGAESWRSDELRVRDARETDPEDLARSGLKYLGRPYVTGGVGSPGFDCSGFVCRVYAEAGYAIPRVSRDQAQAGEEVPPDALQAGDLLFFAEDGAPISHVGMYLGDGHLIHASTGRGEVVVASLESSWFRERLVSARRILTTTSTDAGVGTAAPVRELAEHEGRFSLPMTLQRPSRRPLPSSGPELTGAGVTSIGFRSGFITEAGVLGGVLAPEATLRIDDWAFEIAIAVPIRLEIDEDVTLGTFDEWQDYTRFLRTLSLGLPGAALELRLSRLGEASVGSGAIFDRVAAGTVVRGVPGLTVARTPLSFFGAVRTDLLEVEAFMEDVVDPSVLAVSAAVPLGALRIGAAVATDQAGVRLVGAGCNGAFAEPDVNGACTPVTRALTAGEGFVRIDAVDDRTVSLDFGLSGSALSALGEVGGGGALSSRLQWRPKGSVTFGAEVHGGVLGARYLAGFFGPTYLASRAQHSEALAQLGTRGFLEGRAHLRLRQFAVGATYGQGIGANHHPLDRRIEGYVAVEALPITRKRRLDVRFTLLSRALFHEDFETFTAHGGLRATVFDWMFAELYVQKSETWEGGGGLTVTWAP